MVLVDIRRGERLAFVGALVTLFGVVAGHTMLETARDALFLARLPASRLPIAYLGIALCAFASGIFTNRLTWRVGRRRALVVMLVLGAVGSACFWAAYDPNRTWLFYLLYIWIGTVGTSAAIAFWLLASESFTIAQGKRLFGLVGTGGSLGAIGGAGLAGLWADRLPVHHLLLVGAALQLVASIGVFIGGASVADQRRCLFCLRSSTETFLTAFRTMSSRPYLKHMAALVAISTATLMMVDFQFKSSVASSVPASHLGVFFGTVYACVAGVSLLLQTFAAGGFIKRLGVVAGLAILPVLLLGASGFLAVTGWLIAAVTLKVSDGALRYSFHKTGLELLYMPLSVELRDRIKNFVDGFVARGSQALTSTFLLVITTLGYGSYAVVGTLIGASALIWLLVSFRLRAPYLDLFRKTLASGTIDTRVSFPELDVTSLGALISALNSEEPRIVVSALEVLREQNKDQMIPALILYHDSVDVLVKALAIFEASGRRDFAPLAKRLLNHAVPEVRAAAVRACHAAGVEREILEPLTADPDPVVRAVVAVTFDDRQLLHELAKGSPEVRAALLENTQDAELVLEMADAGSPIIVRAASRAMRRLGDRRFIPFLIATLRVRATRHEVRDMLVALGAPALDALEHALRAPDTALELRRHIPRTISPFHTQRAADILLENFEAQDDGVTRFKILRGLGRMVAENPQLRLDAAVLRRCVVKTAQRVHHYIAWHALLRRAHQEKPELATDCGRLLVEILEDKRRLSLERCFRILALMFPREQLFHVYSALQSDQRRTRAAAFEILESTLTGDIRAWVLPLCDDLDDTARLERIAAQLGVLPTDYASVLRELLVADSENLAALTAYHISELQLAELEKDVAAVPTTFKEVRTVIEFALQSLRGPPVVPNAG